MRFIRHHMAGLLQVPDTLLAERFYAQGLGLTADPGSTGSQRGGVRVTWYNIGKQQVRAAKCCNSAAAYMQCQHHISMIVIMIIIIPHTYLVQIGS